MNKSELLASITLDAQRDELISSHMEERIEKAKADAARIKLEWEEFFDEAFPDQIVDVVYKINNNGDEVRCEKDYGTHSIIYPKITTSNGVHIGYGYDKNSLYFEYKQMVVAFYSNKKERCYRMWIDYPITFWKCLTAYFSTGNRECDIADNVNRIKNISLCEEMLQKTKEVLPEIYKKIADANAELVDRRAKKALAGEEVKPSEPKKTYQIKIIVEEV